MAVYCLCACAACLHACACACADYSCVFRGYNRDVRFRSAERLSPGACARAPQRGAPVGWQICHPREPGITAVYNSHPRCTRARRLGGPLASLQVRYSAVLLQYTLLRIRISHTFTSNSVFVASLLTHSHTHSNTLRVFVASLRSAPHTHTECSSLRSSHSWHPNANARRSPAPATAAASARSSAQAHSHA